MSERFPFNPGKYPSRGQFHAFMHVFLALTCSLFGEDSQSDLTPAFFGTDSQTIQDLANRLSRLEAEAPILPEGYGREFIVHQFGPSKDSFISLYSRRLNDDPVFPTIDGYFLVRTEVEKKLKRQTSDDTHQNGSFSERKEITEEMAFKLMSVIRMMLMRANHGNGTKALNMEESFSLFSSNGMQGMSFSTRMNDYGARFLNILSAFLQEGLHSTDSKAVADLQDLFVAVMPSEGKWTIQIRDPFAP